MTTPSREQVEQWRIEVVKALKGINGNGLYWDAYAEKLATLAYTAGRAAALDESKAKCIQVSERYMETEFHKYAELQSNAVVGASDCAAAIDELKDPQP